MPNAAFEREREWAERIQRWQASGLTMRRFAEQEGIRPNALSWWKWKLSKSAQRRGAGARNPALTALTLVATPTDSAQECPIEVVLSGTRSVFVRRGFDAETLLQVVEALERRAAPAPHLEPPAPEVDEAEPQSCWTSAPSQAGLDG